MTDEAWSFKRYDNPDDVGWLGWLEVLGECIAFIGLDRRIVWAGELKGGREDEHG